MALVNAAVLAAATRPVCNQAADYQSPSPQPRKTVEGVAVGVNFNDGGPRRPEFSEHIFRDASADRWHVPAISSNDLAHDVKPVILQGAPHALSGGGGRLTDGAGPADDDAPADCFFFDNGLAVGRVRISLSANQSIAQINIYSWHRNLLSGGLRAPHRVDVYASDGAGDDFDIDDPHGPGYRLLAQVDTTQPGGVNAQSGQHGSSVHAESRQPLGMFRHFIFEVFPPLGGPLHSFLCEVDVIGAPTAAKRSSSVSVAQARFFDERIAPLLASRCLECHNASENKGGLNLSSIASVTAGGDSGPPIVAGSPDDSYLIQRVESEDMPPDKPLPEEEKKLLREWIAAGADWGDDPIDRFRFSSETRAGYDWWSLRPLQKPEIPVVDNRVWIVNDIDRFVLAKLEAKGLAPSPPADRRTLIRRLSFDLTGLPPTLEETAEFVDDESPGAYERLVDRLLASPRYGERWARHWLDVVRFAESQGFERNKFYPSAWKYRDWVIQALNDDMPYDEFIRQQLAGDQLHPDDPSAAAATGYLVCTPHDLLGLIQGSDAMRANTREDELENLVGNVGQTFIGMTVNCARCHDHKFDPLHQREYYQLAAALGGIERSVKMVEPKSASASEEALESAMCDADRRLRQALGAEGEALLRDARAAAIQAAQTSAEAAEEKVAAAAPSVNSPDKEAAANARQVLADRRRESDAARDDLRAAENPYSISSWDAICDRLSPFVADAAKPLVEELSALEQRARLSAPGPVQSFESSPPQYFHLLARGNLRDPQEVASPRGLECVSSLSADWGLPPNAPEGERRVKLADWITNPSNPLTARVMANRVWHYHFGAGIVETPNDFGFSGGRPSHAELLDWLALQLMESRWSLKELHRTMVLSATYRQSATHNAEAAQIDADNRLLWRKSPLRLDAEAVRDAVLAVSGSLNPRIGGPSFRDVEINFADNVAYRPVDVFGPIFNRRTIYRTVARAATPPLLETLDCADPTVATPQRTVTTTPLQALSLLNNPLTAQVAGALAARVERSSAGAVDRQIEEIYLLTLSRPPTAEEIDGGRAFVASHGLAEFCLAMFNSSEFIYVD